MDSEKLFTMNQLVQVLDVPKYRILYLFDSRRLKAEEFSKTPDGRRLYRESDIAKIKKALFETQAR